MKILTNSTRKKSEIHTISKNQTLCQNQAKNCPDSGQKSTTSGQFHPKNLAKIQPEPIPDKKFIFVNLREFIEMEIASQQPENITCTDSPDVDDQYLAELESEIKFRLANFPWPKYVSLYHVSERYGMKTSALESFARAHHYLKFRHRKHPYILRSDIKRLLAHYGRRPETEPKYARTYEEHLHDTC